VYKVAAARHEVVAERRELADCGLRDGTHSWYHRGEGGNKTCTPRGRVNSRLSQHLGDVRQRQDQRGNYSARCKIATDRKRIAIMIKRKFIGKLALMLAAGCLSVGMLGVGASAQTPRALITVVIGDNHHENMSLGVAAKLLVSHVCGVDERDAREIVELAAKDHQKIVAICPGTGAVFHVIP